ncbi:MAG TPA: serine/threonine-protein kinase [Acidimicrobiales bacterium]
MGVDLLAGRYELGSVIGRGRSPVHEARDTRLGRDVAVKRVALAPGPDEIDDVRARTLREARAAARLASSRVVNVYDVIEEADAIWLVMELVRAPSLDEIIREQGPLPAALAARIGLGVGHALAAAHDAGVLHRDVKPANVLVAVDGDSVDVKLADFGVAALRDESGVTLPGMVVGSPSYMAPEQASGQAVGPEADLWALGALLYFAIEGVPPFSRGSALATAAAVVHAEPRPHHHPGVLTPLIDALLVKDPARRPEAGAVLRSLRVIAAASSGPAWSPATTQQAAAVATVGETTVVSRLPSGSGGGAPTRQTRPHRRRTALVAAAVAALLAGAATQVFGVGTSPSQSGPPAADAQTVPAPAAPSTSATVASGGRAGVPSATTATPDDTTPAVPDTSATAAPGTVPTTATPAAPTTTAPDEPDTTSGPPDTSAPTTTTSAPPEETTPPTTVQSGG